jgi:hypothetical protein
MSVNVRGPNHDHKNLPQQLVLHDSEMSAFVCGAAVSIALKITCWYPFRWTRLKNEESIHMHGVYRSLLSIIISGQWSSCRCQYAGKYRGV